MSTTTQSIGSVGDNRICTYSSRVIRMLASSGNPCDALALLWRGWSTRPMWAKALITAVATSNLVLLGITIYGFYASPAGYDWRIFEEAGRRVLHGGLYTWAGSYAWSYSPLLAYLFVALAPIGFIGWAALHFVALAAVPIRRLAILALFLWPFWVDVYNGNTMTFVFVAAVGALHRNGLATIAYLVLCLLMPRPVMLPLLVWILWHQPASRRWFVLLIGVNTLAVFGTGHAVDWAGVLLNVGDAVSTSSRDVGPGVLVGAWWTVAGAALAVMLTIRGRIGWASLAASPYWLPQYLLMLCLEWVPPSVSHADITMRRGEIPESR